MAPETGAGREPEREASRWVGRVAGLIGGAVGTAAMTYYQKKMAPLMERSRTDGSGARKREHDVSLIGRKHRTDESSTAALGRIVYQKVTKTEPDDRTQNRLSNIVHWTYGTAMGGTYGLIRGPKEGVDLSGGLGYGAALWMAGDEAAIPLLGLAEGPKGYPATLHVETLGAHLVYGAVVAATTQLVRRILS